MINNTFCKICFLYITILSCKKQVTPIDISNLPEENKTNVSYGKDPAQKMDIFLPAKRNTNDTKVVFLIHTGAWIEGDKSDFYPIVDTLKKRLPHWAIVNINFRLATTWGNYFPTQENDINTAINFVYNNLSKYYISNKWVYMGASSGAQLALLQGYKHTDVIKPKLIVNFYGPTDINELLTNPGSDSPPVTLMQTLFGTYVSSSSPVNYVTSSAPPTISFHGSDDHLVLPIHQTILHNKLIAEHVPESHTLYLGEGHGFSDSTMTKAYNTIVNFINQYTN